METKYPINIFEEIEKLNFPQDQFIIAGSGIMAAAGIRPAYDLDIVITRELFDLCHKNGWELKPWTRTGRQGKPWLLKGDTDLLLEITCEDKDYAFNDLINETVIISGVHFLSLEQLVRFKTAYGRPKDFEDIALIKSYLNKNYKSFICAISNAFETEEESKLIQKIEDQGWRIETVFMDIPWTPPVEYEQEMGVDLKTKIYVLKDWGTKEDLVRLKNFTISTEKSAGRKRIFNLNPGYFSDEGMFLLSHKFNESRERRPFGHYWTEKQYDIHAGKFIPNQNTFSEYQNDRLKIFNEYWEQFSHPRIDK